MSLRFSYLATEVKYRMMMEEKDKTMKRLIWVALLLVLVIAAVFIILESRFVSSKDACVEADCIQIVPKVPGRISNIEVEGNQFVDEDDLIVELEAKDYKIKLDEAISKYNVEIVKQERARVEFKTATEEIQEAQKGLEECKANCNSEQDLEEAMCGYKIARQNLDIANQNLLDTTNNKEAEDRLKQLAAKKHQAELDLANTKIYAPQSGYILNNYIKEGDYVEAGKTLISIAPSKVWITAEFKGGQLKNIKIGQIADIMLDVYPGKVFRGEVSEIQGCFGSKNAPHSCENKAHKISKPPIKIIVKVIFDEKISPRYKIIPGMSAKVKIRVK